MLQACLNGDRRRSATLSVPQTPEELARDAVAVAAVGADEVHIHPRGADGLESLDPDDVASALRAIRAAVPGVPVGLSTRAPIRPGGRARHAPMRAWTELPDYVSVNLIEEDAPDVIALMREREIGIEAGVWSAADARRFVELPRAGECLRVLIEINEQDAGEALRAVGDICGVLDDSGLTPPRLLHGLDATMWPLYREALRLGFDARIGFEDGLRLPDGEPASSNAQLIEAAATMAASARRFAQR